MADIKPQDVQIGITYRQIDNGTPIESITIRTAGGFQQLPSRGDGIEVIENSTGKKISGYITKITHGLIITGGGATDEASAHTIFVDIET